MEAREVCKAYGGRTIIDHYNYLFLKGDRIGIIGPNGCGKSTLLKVISGVYKPSAGKVTVNGTIAPLIELGAGFDMDLTARENIYLNGTVLGYTPKYIDSKFDDIVEFSELQNSTISSNFSSRYLGEKPRTVPLR